MSIRVINVKPSIENVDPYKKYQLSTPSNFSLQENPILYGGGRNWKFVLSEGYQVLQHYITARSSSNSNSSNAKNPDRKEFAVDIFVLNTSFIIWFVEEDLDFGIELPYEKVILHALRKNSANQSLLYLQLKGDSDNQQRHEQQESAHIQNQNQNENHQQEEQQHDQKDHQSKGKEPIKTEDYDRDAAYETLVEAYLVPILTNVPSSLSLSSPSSSSPRTETLFTEDFFGKDHRGDKMVDRTFTALSKCSALHFDSDSDMDHEHECEYDAGAGGAGVPVPSFPIIDNSTRGVHGDGGTREVLINTAGQADDIEEDEDTDEEHGLDADIEGAGIEVKINGGKTGVVRQRDEEDDYKGIQGLEKEGSKVRKL